MMRTVNTNQKNVLGDDFWLVDMQDRWKVKNRNAVCSASWWLWASFSYLTCCSKYVVWLMNNVSHNRLHDIFSTQDLCVINTDLNCSPLINFYGDDNKYRFDAHFIDIIGLPHEPEGGNEIASRGWMCNGFNPEGEARGMTQLHIHPRDAIPLPPKGSCSNPIVSWFTIQLLKETSYFLIATNFYKKFVKSSEFCQFCKWISKNSSN